jgi:hypothetical protein
MSDSRLSPEQAQELPPLPRRRAVLERVLAAAAGGSALVAVAGLCIAAFWTPGLGVAANTDLYAQFCTPVPGAAVVPERVSADHRIDVRVPLSAMAPELDGDSHATQILRGEVVELRITAPIEGAASVHGLSDLVRMPAGGQARLRFRAIYSGRFYLHFHGADGSHFGVWALNISPRSPS